MAVFHQFLLTLSGSVADQRHRPEDCLPGFVRREAGKPLFRGQLDVDTHPVGQQAEPFDQLSRCTGNRFDVDVAAKTVFLAQQTQCLDHAFAGRVGTAADRRA